MTQQAKAPKKSVFDPQDPHGGIRELLSTGCPQISTYVMVGSYICSCVYTHTKQSKQIHKINTVCFPSYAEPKCKVTCMYVDICIFMWACL